LGDEELFPVINNYFQIINRSAERLEIIMVSLNNIIQLGDHSPDVVTPVSAATVFADVQEEFAESAFTRFSNSSNGTGIGLYQPSAIIKKIKDIQMTKLLKCSNGLLFVLHL